MFIEALFTITKIWKQPKCPSVDKTTVEYLNNRIQLGHKREVNFTLCNSMDGPGEHCAE